MTGIKCVGGGGGKDLSAEMFVLSKPNKLYCLHNVIDIFSCLFCLLSPTEITLSNVIDHRIDIKAVIVCINNTELLPCDFVACVYM